MLCFLKDAESKSCKDEIVRNWLREIRSLAYRIEDLVETYAVQVAAKKSPGRRGFRKFLKRSAGIFGELRSLHKIGNEIENVKDEISSITASFQRYDIKAIGGDGESSSSQNEQYQQWVRQTYAHEVEDHFVGMENDIAKLVSVVTDDHKNHRIISIWGMGGLGKTTLARKVYKHKDVQRYFERFAWVCVTQQAQIKAILQDLLMQLLPEKKDDVRFMEGRELVQQLYQVQMESKCLIVLDDIWKVDDWKSILAAFPVATGDIKVLFTTRNRKVAEIGFLYELKCLSETEGWELLQKIAFSSGTTDFETVPSFKDIGRELVSKCGGLPLAISVLGGILKHKDSLADWEIVNRHIGLYLHNMEDNGETDGGSVGRVLSLSYDELPYHLKLCFLYLGCFKEDEEIRADHLYLLWMAEGFVLSKHRTNGETLLDVAKRYLNELGQRSMVQLKVDEFSLNKRFHSCRLHDIMRDLCLEKGREEEFVKIINPKEVNQSMVNTDDVAHRLVIHIDLEENSISSIALENWQQTRSLLCLSTVSGYSENEMIWPRHVAMQKLKLLRVLKFEGFNFQGQTFPVEFQDLIHLRILSFKYCKLHELPSSVAELPLLHTLNLEVKYEIKIPDVLWRMKRLRHLYFSFKHCTDVGKLRLHGLRELETLWALQGEVDEIADLSELINLRALYAIVKDDYNLYALLYSINMNGQNLHEINLSIDHCDFISTEEGYDLLLKVLTCKNLHRLYFDAKLVEFPNYENGFLQGLAMLRLSGNNMEEDPMEALGQLPQLRSLVLGRDAYMGECMICHERGFPQLRSLIFNRQPNLEYWRVDEGSMPKLSHLEIWDCDSLFMVPHGLIFVKGLKEIKFGGMPYEFCDRVTMEDGQEGDDYYKIKHVPSISVLYPR
ncbi:OLC1v1019545C1 [Oldenlandia corymbosa var. corymbosa]|nr:OLC1v1019545C1 [Oldenlandia corymbosa var. corymbosa]